MLGGRRDSCFILADDRLRAPSPRHPPHHTSCTRFEQKRRMWLVKICKNWTILLLILNMIYFFTLKKKEEENRIIFFQMLKGIMTSLFLMTSHIYSILTSWYHIRLACFHTVCLPCDNISNDIVDKNLLTQYNFFYHDII